MEQMKIGPVASYLEKVALAMDDGGLTPEDNRYIGLEDTAKEAISHLLTAMFPHYLGSLRDRFVSAEKRTWELMRAFDALSSALRCVINCRKQADIKAAELIQSLPDILDVLRTDIQAAYEGDPAATSTDEVILTYPAFKAISIYRIAHKLYQMKVPILPRVMTEYAHQLTGIDIHPGATIGRYFFIDHGTGVVIGETTTIGEHVKLYQHVTLGAKSFALAEDGTPVKGVKRHPDIGDYVVIYAGATILGGNTVIGDHCVVGGNVWLTHSLPPGETVTVRIQQNSRNSEDYIEYII
ncbi:MAG: serine acetyltransferase [Firmicutes bacterium]|nr:serine acetyltransferase [Bacillota bacterium]MBQ3286713.1 serine acetyltransferase [Bacillota bacterium]MBR0179027.1 serine acetyltransferase [Bacillota bacterium]